MKNSNELIKAEKIILIDGNYLTDDGRIITRVATGRRGTTIRWKVEGIDFLYRNLFEAYYNKKF